MNCRYGGDTGFFAGLKIVNPDEARVFTLFGRYHGTVKTAGFCAYSGEIAAAILRRQQAAAIIAARQKIVDGAVGMVKMALDKPGEDDIVILDEVRKASMVSNLPVVLCGIVN